MTVAAADLFIRQIINRPDLARQLNAAPDQASVHQILSGLNLVFTREDFETAYTNLLTCCQILDRAEMLKEIKLWWDWLEVTLAQAETDRPQPPAL